jgi:amidase
MAPDQNVLAAIARLLNLPLSADELGHIQSDVTGAMEGLNALFATVHADPLPRYPGTRSFHFPTAANDPLHAWYVHTTIPTASTGPLAGRQVAVKDTLAVADVPMMNGASTLDGYVPEFDATVVTRLLEAGANIVGKTHCEYLCASGGSHTNATGPTLNPHNPAHTTGGSSSGSAALVGAGLIDIAIGGDQGGSIRAPAAFCGAYGMKPTHGLVPYTGIFPIEMTLDHVGPITRTVADNALALSVIAGSDGLDPRQYAPTVQDYQAALYEGVQGLRVGIVDEGFAWPQTEPDVAKACRNAAELLGQAGADVVKISIPLHEQGLLVWLGIVAEGLNHCMMQGNSMGSNWRGFYPVSMIEAHRHWRDKAPLLPANIKLYIMLGEYLTRTFGGTYYAQAQNLSRKLARAYDEALADVDILLMPTTPIKAPKLPAQNPSWTEFMAPGFVSIPNTAPFDATGHPGISVPCGMSDGLPIGVMLTGRPYDEATLYRAAATLERVFDWRNYRPSLIA